MKGDRNTSYFYHYASQRKARNCISSLTDPLGQVLEVGMELEDYVVSFYDCLFSYDMCQVYYESLFVDALFRTLSESDIVILSSPFTQKEVEFALKDICPKKAPILMDTMLCFIGILE